MFLDVPYGAVLPPSQMVFLKLYCGSLNRAGRGQRSENKVFSKLSMKRDLIVILNVDVITIISKYREFNSSSASGKHVLSSEMLHRF